MGINKYLHDINFCYQTVAMYVQTARVKLTFPGIVSAITKLHPSDDRLNDFTIKDALWNLIDDNVLDLTPERTLVLKKSKKKKLALDQIEKQCDHVKAEIYSRKNRKTSNLARCYLDLWNMMEEMINANP